MTSTCTAFFPAAPGHPPHDRQRRLAGGEPSQISDPESAIRAAPPCRSQLIHIPTGLGKTAADAVGSAQPTHAAQP